MAFEECLFVCVLHFYRTERKTDAPTPQGEKKKKEREEKRANSENQTNNQTNSKQHRLSIKRENKTLHR
jgi:hypothetical protein